MRSVFVLALAAILLGACGAVGGGAAPPPGSPSPSPGAGFDVTVTENTHAVTLRTGQTLAVVLHARVGMADWTSVRSSDQSVLAPIVNPAASAARGVTLAAFKAIAPGAARIDATAAPDCSPGVACPAYVMLLTIEVTVSAG
ncbi:MAG TPA: hypothetical protein VND96_03785 [Candidatus Micrarchaeaceae archaeon]|nr:hypothetical protein [Candidatus Micrarchaeaceae archaeon]